jgi:hypothetical protein
MSHAEAEDKEINRVDNLLSTFVQITLKDKGDFLKIKETLTRIGFLSKRDSTLWQSCHIFHKRNKLYIVHFKELFSLDGKTTDFTQDDLARRNTIANLLQDWGLLTISNPEICEEPRSVLSQIRVLSFREKHNWKLEAKYTIGNSRRKDNTND